MRDSNPRGLAPNPLSKLPPQVLIRVPEVCNERRSRVCLLGEQKRTRATETRTETTTAWATASDRVGRRLPMRTPLGDVERLGLITAEPVNRYQVGCAVGRSKILFKVRRRGLVTAIAITSATSETWMASRRSNPSVVCLVASSVMWSMSSVATAPGSVTVTRMSG
jgi:hypothetical protein